MESLQVSVNVVIPMAILMGIGVLLRVLGITNAAVMKKVDKITYNVFTPALVLYNIYATDFSELSNSAYMLYGAGSMLLIFILCLLLSPRLISNQATAASFSQGVVRPNYVIFGAAVAQSLYGEGNIGLVMLMGALSVPMINIMSVIILEKGRNGNASIKQLLISIFKNPLMIAVFGGLALNFLDIRLPVVLEKVASDLGSLATPISFLSIGVTLGFSASTKSRLLALAVTLRLVVIPLIFVTAAIFLGFREQELLSLLILFGAPVAVSSYPMAVAMDADGELAGQLVAVTTAFCLVTIFLWTFVLNGMKLL